MSRRPTLVVIAGPANSGKLPLARVMAAEYQEAVVVHRDQMRHAVVHPHFETEADLTLYMVDFCEFLLKRGVDVIAVSQNLMVEDRERWHMAALCTGAVYRWLDTRDPLVHRLIPPLAGWSPATYEGVSTCA